MIINKAFAGRQVSYNVAEEWLGKISVPAIGDRDEAIIRQALADPQASGVVSTDTFVQDAIDKTKELVDRAKELNASYGSDVTVTLAMKDDGKIDFAVSYKKQLYGEADTQGEAKTLLNKLEEYLKREGGNKVKVATLSGKDKTPLQRGMALEAFTNSYCYKVIAVTDDGADYTVVYVPYDWRSRVASRHGGREDEDYDE